MSKKSSWFFKNPPGLGWTLPEPMLLLPRPSRIDWRAASARGRGHFRAARGSAPNQPLRGPQTGDRRRL